MANTQPLPPKKSRAKSLNFWNTLATIGVSAFTYFSLTPDTTAAADLAKVATDATNAIEARNWAALALLFVSSGNLVWHIIKPLIGK
jgi:hypothetical protein